MRGVLQAAGPLTFPEGSIADVTLRVVGRNTKGPIAQLSVPLDGKSFPVEYVVSRSNLREGLPDYIWEADDIYVKAGVVTSKGKELYVGRSKAKAVQRDGRTVHDTAFLTLE